MLNWKLQKYWETKRAIDTITTVSNEGRVSEHEERTSQMVNWRSVIDGKAKDIASKTWREIGLLLGLAYPSM